MKGSLTDLLLGIGLFITVGFTMQQIYHHTNVLAQQSHIDEYEKNETSMTYELMSGVIGDTELNKMSNRVYSFDELRYVAQTNTPNSPFWGKEVFILTNDIYGRPQTHTVITKDMWVTEEQLNEGNINKYRGNKINFSGIDTLRLYRIDIKDNTKGYKVYFGYSADKDKDNEVVAYIVGSTAWDYFKDNRSQYLKTF